MAKRVSVLHKKKTEKRRRRDASGSGIAEKSGGNCIISQIAGAETQLEI